jgi:protein-S-isoprenylcysteine O-methyltransferase Ste14
MSVRMTSAEAGARVRFPPPLVFFACIWAGVGLGAMVPAPVPVQRAIRLVIGVAVQLLAVALVASARIRFHRTGQSPVPWKPSPQLILDGPYRFTRNPMYVGVTLFQIGLGVTLDDLWISAAAWLALVVHFIAVLPEERYLSTKFGEPYDRYVARVRRYL